MKRLNPETNQPFKRGDIREDGRLFKGYKTTVLKQNGFFIEEWLLPERFQRLRELAAAHYTKNIEYYKNRGKLNKLKNRHYYTALQANRRAAKLLRTPPWLTFEHKQEIKAMYFTAKQLEKEYGEKMHVDHIVPLVNPRVSGLHVPWNLQILTEEQNTKKSNKFSI